MEYMNIMFEKILDTIGDHHKVETIPYDIICDVDIFNDYVEWLSLFSVTEKRKKLIDTGANIAMDFYTSLQLTSESTESSEEHIKNEVAEDSVEVITSLGEEEKGEKGEKGEK